MSIIGETRALLTALKLEGIILSAIRDRRWGDVRSAAIGFAREELYQWYLEECDTAFREPSPDIVKVCGKWIK